MQAEEFNKSAQQKKDRLKKLYGERKNSGNLDDDGDSEKRQRDHHSNRNLDLLA